jgi:two-component system, OmpR family, sensor kinase
MKLVHRLALLLSCAVASILLMCFSLAYGLVQRDERRDLDTELAELAGAIGDEVHRDDPAHIKLWQNDVRRGGVYVAWYNRDNSLAQTNAAFRGRAPARAEPGVVRESPIAGPLIYHDMEIADDSIRCVRSIQDEGTLLVAVSRRPMLRDIRFLRSVLGGLFLVGLVISLLVAWVVARSIAADIQVVGQVARSVASGDLTARVNCKNLRTLETRGVGDDLNAMISDLQRVIEAQRVFVSHAAHELRSPLATLRGELQLCLRKLRSPEQYRETIVAVDEQAVALGALAEDLLALARARDRTLLDVEVRSPVLELVNAACAACRGAAQRSKVRVRTEESPLLAVSVAATPPDGARALRNLLDNAIAHSAPGAVVHIELRRDANMLVIGVVDDGPGVLTADIPHLFVPFWRSQAEQAAATGAGLGLSIAREIAQKFGGNVVYATARVGEGARFELALPVADGG